MDDVFGGLAGGPGEGSRASGPDLTVLDRALDGAALWGLELDPRFRVLAATFEPTTDRYPWPATADRRIQVLCFPVSTILGSFRREQPLATELLSFTEEQLVDVVATFDGASVSSPIFRRPEPRPGEWGPRYSLEGRSTAPDGVGNTLRLSLRRDELVLELFARFDEVQLKGPDGAGLVLPDHR